MWQRLLAFLTFVFIIGCLSACSSNQLEIGSIELGFTRCDWPERVEVAKSAVILEQLQKELPRWQSGSGRPVNQAAPSYYLQITLLNHDEPQIYLLTHDLRMFNKELRVEYFPPPHTRQVLKTAVEELKQQRFGQLMRWQEAQHLLPLYSTFQLMDLETGIIWDVQRRGGSSHADIQPLTKQDTEKLRAVYGGHWSWDRRAVIVLVGDKRIAGSINGMPHGAGALPNGFPGHHCLHFWQSTTHSKSHPDAAHQVMVHKAAGCLNLYLQNLEAEDLQLAMLEMAGQGETDILRLGIRNLATGSDPSQLAKHISNLRIWDSRRVEESDKLLVVNYRVSIYFVGDAKEYRKTITVTSRYHEEWERWLVEPDFLEQLIG